MGRRALTQAPGPPIWPQRGEQTVEGGRVARGETAQLRSDHTGSERGDGGVQRSESSRGAVGVPRGIRALDGRRRQSSRDLPADGARSAGKGDDEARAVPRREARQQAQDEDGAGPRMLRRPQGENGPERARRALPSTTLAASRGPGLGLSLPRHKAQNQEFPAHVLCHRSTGIPLVNANNRGAGVLY